MRECGYPEWTLKPKRSKKTDRSDVEDHYATVSIPYVKSTSEKLARIFKKFRIRTTHKPTTTLKQLLCKTKDEVHTMDKVGAVYEVTCTRHNETYIGETGRALKTRAYEHAVITHEEATRCHSLQQEKLDVRPPELPDNVRRSGRLATKDPIDYKEMHTGSNIITNEGSTEVSKHVAKLNHKEGDIMIKPIVHETSWNRRLYREAMEIRRRKPTLNAAEDGGKRKIPAVYNLFLKKPAAEKLQKSTVTRPPSHSDEAS